MAQLSVRPSTEARRLGVFGRGPLRACTGLGPFGLRDVKSQSFGGRSLASLGFRLEGPSSLGCRACACPALAGAALCASHGNPEVRD